MPGMSGWEVCRRLRADSASKDISVIIATAVQTEDTDKRVKEVGANAVIIKPFDSKRLLDLINQQIET